MSRMMHLFRKYQYMLLIVFGCLLMFVFVIGDALTRMMDSGGPSGSQSDDVVLTWKHGAVTGSELYNQRVRHNMALEYLSEVVQETVRREGTPKGPGVYQDQFGRYNPGITVADSEEAIVRKMLLAAKAESLGVKVDNEAVRSFLKQLCDHELNDNDLAVVFNKTVGNGRRMTQQHLMDQLKHELLAEQMIMMARTSLMSPNNLTPRVTPHQAWEFHQRMRRRVQTEMVALKVDDFKDQVSKTPSEHEINELYEEGKDRFADPYSPEPGFKRRRKLAFEYVRADSTKLQEEEATKIKDDITDEDIEKYYEENKERYKVIELPETDTASEEAATEDKPADTEADAETPAEEEKDASPEDEAPTPPAEKDAAPEPPKEGEAEATTPAEETTPEPETEEAEGDNCGQDDKPTEESTEEAAESPSEEAAAPEQPAEEEASTSSDAPAEEVKKEETEPASESEAEPAASEATEGAAKSETTEAETETSSSESTEEEADETQYKQLDDKLRAEIRDEIAADRSRQPAQERLDKAFEDIKSNVDAYGRKLRRIEVTNSGDKPPAVDYETLATDYGFTAGKIDPTDVIGIADFDLGKAYEMAFTSWPPQRISFAQKAYLGPLQSFRADRIKSAELDVEFLYWMVEEEDAYVPELADIRDEVIDTWKRQKALEIAKAEANNLAKQAEADKPLGDSLDSHDGLEVTQPTPFSWMSTGSTPFGGAGAPTLSTVDGVEAAGNDFMTSVFGLSKGETGVAVNQPETVVYVVRIAAETPSEELLREQFLSAGVTPEVSQIAFAEIEGVWQSWYSDLETEMQVDWK